MSPLLYLLLSCGQTSVKSFPTQLRPGEIGNFSETDSVFHLIPREEGIR